MDNLQSRIKKERQDKKLSQAELGDMLGINNTQISNYEKGIRIPPVDILIKMADIFGCTTDYLLCRTDNSSSYVTEININENKIKITSSKQITEAEALEFFKQYIGK